MSVVLYQFVTEWDLPNLSPFCLKVETWLRLVDVPYEVRPFSPGLTSTGKAPVVELDGERISDSSCIVRTLSERLSIGLDAGLTPRQLAHAALVQRVLEEHLYWAVLHTRWVDDAGWATYRPILASALPMPRFLALWLASYLRRGVKRSTWEHGLARHAPDEIHRRGIEDLTAIAEILGDSPFLLGDTPRSVDCGMYAFLAQAAHPAWDNALVAHLRADARLMAYIERMRARVWDAPAS
ncbi:MAG: glutathione S-transferase family protein [Myxococcota bacterium]